MKIQKILMTMLMAGTASFAMQEEERIPLVQSIKTLDNLRNDEGLRIACEAYELVTHHNKNKGNMPNNENFALIMRNLEQNVRTNVGFVFFIDNKFCFWFDGSHSDYHAKVNLGCDPTDCFTNTYQKIRLPKGHVNQDFSLSSVYRNEQTIPFVEFDNLINSIKANAILKDPDMIAAQKELEEAQRNHGTESDDYKIAQTLLDCKKSVFLLGFSSLDSTFAHLLDTDQPFVICGHSFGALQAQIQAYKALKDCPEKGHLMTVVSFGGSPFLISKEEQEHFDYLIPNSYWVTHQNDPYAYVQLSFGNKNHERYRYHPGTSVVLGDPDEKISLNHKAHEDFESIFGFMKNKNNGERISLKGIEKNETLSKDAMVMATKSFLAFYLSKPVGPWS